MGLDRHLSMKRDGRSAGKTFAALGSLLGVTGDVPTLWLVEPKQKPKPLILSNR